MTSLDEALQVITQYSLILGPETVSIDDAYDRVLAEDIVADRDYPPFNRSAMDGYAIRHEDWINGIREYLVLETILAGQPASKKLESGFAYKIMTGAAVPLPANVVIRVEDAVVSGQTVTLAALSMKPYLNIARQGEDLLAGNTIAHKYTRLSPQMMSILAVVGRKQVMVQKLPSVAVVTTGDEVVEVGQSILPYQIRNSNAYLIRSMLRDNGIIPGSVVHVKDHKEEIAAALQNALQSDVVIVNGGVSAGDADYVPQLLEGLGVGKLFHKVAIRPGKPIWVGVKQNVGLVFALPGNPFSCMVTFNLFVRLALRLMQGLKPQSDLKLPFQGMRPKKINLDEFFPVRVNRASMTVQAVSINGSGDIRLGLNADAIALHPAGTDQITDGDLVQFFFL
jgi:molybdopterin molybdotransferase